MSTFRVTAEWFGKTLGTNYILFQGITFKRFLKTEFAFDLDVTNSTVELAGPGSDSITDTNDEVITSAPSFTVNGVPVYLVWFSTSEITDRFDGRAEGWRPRGIVCAAPVKIEDAGFDDADPEGDDGPSFGQGTLPPREFRGVEVKFKAQINSGTISTTSAAPTAKIVVKGQELSIPTGPSTTKTSGAAATDCSAKHQLCPDGKGGFTVREIELRPAAGTVVLVDNITLQTFKTES